ncbi:cutinase transcription factor 1 alpha [Neofusicoccum parvum]|uniref:Putative c6 transcription factor protein n=1 Tax=Botryosphaeria parva (strain UCR-NP2) TaxID=1287680 RepID=R1E8F0_BOTPV|nr:putative c6 transcription factor protein [Neofusicoccum parvum UCRNP2]GME64278.1 cutinase transcription factor 1 alpha [Neofusicoccum parvum]
MCHSRKTKCDALTTYPCTRCRDSRLQCTLRVSHRGRPRRGKRAGSRGEAPPGLATPSSEAPEQPPRAASAAAAAASSPVDLIRSLEYFIEHPHGPVDDERSVAIVHATDNNALASVLRAAAGADPHGRNVHLYVGPSSSCSAVDRYNEALARFDPDTRSFLAAKGIFDRPGAALAAHLVQNFFDYADPHLPLIHKTDFLERFRAKSVPLLLLQSVFFVGSLFADDGHVSAAGWPSRAHMTASFFDKAKLIADFEIESDQITLVQSFVLLAERWLGWTDERNTRYWMSRAVNVAYMMGLHRKIETLQLSPSQQRLWARIAWVTMAEYVPSRSPETIKYCVTLVWLGALVGQTLTKLHSSSRTVAEPVTPAVLDELRQRMETLAPDCPGLIDVELQDISTTPKAQLLYGPLLRAGYALVSLFYYWALAERHRDPAVKLESREMLHAAANDVCDVMSYLRAHALFPLCPIWLVAGVFHTCAVLLGDCRDALLGSEEPRKTGSFGRLRQLNDDLGILEETWKPAGWFRELIRISLSKLHEKHDDTQSAVVLCESPGSLFESARELFPDLANIFNWNSADTFPSG